MHESGVKEFQVVAAIAGIEEMLRLARVKMRINVRNLGAWRAADGWHIGDYLIPHQSVDWYIEHGQKASKRKGKLNALAILDAFQTDLFWSARPHYRVLILQSSLYSPKYGALVGLGRGGMGAVISLGSPGDAARDTLGEEYIKTLVMHELGHSFGLLPDDRKKNVKRGLGKHCADTCVMRPGSLVTGGWETVTRDRLRGSPLCGQCLRDLRQFFR